MIFYWLNKLLIVLFVGYEYNAPELGFDPMNANGGFGGMDMNASFGGAAPGSATKNTEKKVNILTLC